MSGQASLAVITTILGLLTAAILALVNSWISARAGVDENLRSQRLEVYPTLWSSTEVFSYWPRAELTRGGLEELHRALRSWYYTKGGLFMSELARARYGDVQKLIATLLAHNGDSADVLVPDSYTDLADTASALRTALTEDLDTRRRKSLLESWRRSRQHRGFARKASSRISQVSTSTSVFTRGGRVGVRGADEHHASRSSRN